MEKYNGIFINTITSDKKLIAQIDAELEGLPKWRIVRRQWLLSRRGKLAKKILKQQAIKANMKDEDYITLEDFFKQVFEEVNAREKGKSVR